MRFPYSLEFWIRTFVRISIPLKCSSASSGRNSLRSSSGSKRWMVRLERLRPLPANVVWKKSVASPPSGRSTFNTHVSIGLLDA